MEDYFGEYTQKMKVRAKDMQLKWQTVSMFVCLFWLCFFLFPACGIYHAAPVQSPPEETLQWSGPLIADAENVKIYFVPRQTTITFNTKEVDTNINLLLNEYKKSEPVESTAIEELSVQVPETGTYVLVIQKTSL
jgi:hypothetical protein